MSLYSVEHFFDIRMVFVKMTISVINTIKHNKRGNVVAAELNSVNAEGADEPTWLQWLHFHQEVEEDEGLNRKYSY